MHNTDECNDVVNSMNDLIKLMQSQPDGDIIAGCSHYLLTETEKAKKACPNAVLFSSQLGTTFDTLKKCLDLNMQQHS